MENQENMGNKKAALAVAIGGLITIVGSIIAYIILCVSLNSVFEENSSNEDKNSQFYGTYTYYDALNHKYAISVYKSGDAFLILDRSSIGDSEIARLAWGEATKGINCIWHVRYRHKGSNTHKGLEVSGEGVEVYLCDGYAYFTYSDFTNYRNGVKYYFRKE